MDFHGVLDWDRTAGPGTTNDRVVAAWKRLLDQGYAPWVCSYIGRGGEKSAQRRAECADTCKYLARSLGLSTELPPGPSREGVFYVVVDSRTGQAGKAEALREHCAVVLIDDRQEVCHDCEVKGIECYRVKPDIQRCRKERQYEDHPSDLSHDRDFPEAVETLIAEAPRTRVAVSP